MKEKLYKLLLFLIYLLLLAAILEFNLALVINLKMLTVVVLGSSILTLITAVKGQKRNHIIIKARVNLIITGIATSFLAELHTIATTDSVKSIFEQTFENFLPLFYAMLFILLLDLFRTKGNTEINTPMVTDTPKTNINAFNLTRREEAVALELLGSLSNKEIGEKLFISENTVKKHVQNIFKKASVKNRTDFQYHFTNEGVELNHEETRNSK